MTGLTDAEREALLTPCECGHTINNHGSLCWVCADDGRPTDCTADFEALLVERVAGIVEAQVAVRLAAIEALAAEARAVLHEACECGFQDHAPPDDHECDPKPLAWDLDPAELRAALTQPAVDAQLVDAGSGGRA